RQVAAVRPDLGGRQQQHDLHVVDLAVARRGRARAGGRAVRLRDWGEDHHRHRPVGVALGEALPAAGDPVVRALARGGRRHVQISAHRPRDLRPGARRQDGARAPSRRPAGWRAQREQRLGAAEAGGRRPRANRAVRRGERPGRRQAGVPGARQLQPHDRGAPGGALPRPRALPPDGPARRRRPALRHSQRRGALGARRRGGLPAALHGRAAAAAGRRA
ncbi:unnamed protein product, partial [Prorocentrum cordatum]